MSKGRGRETSSTPTRAALGYTTRLMGVSPLGHLYTQATEFIPAQAPASVYRQVLSDVTVQPSPARRVVTPPPGPDNLYRPAPQAPSEKNKVCKDRHIRREVIHALGKAGRGGKKPTYTLNSKVKCK